MNIHVIAIPRGRTARDVWDDIKRGAMILCPGDVSWAVIVVENGEYVRDLW
jgi:hypothetical protein